MVTKPSKKANQIIPISISRLQILQNLSHYSFWGGESYRCHLRQEDFVFTCATKKETSYFPFGWLVNRDPYNHYLVGGFNPFEQYESN